MKSDTTPFPIAKDLPPVRSGAMNIGPYVQIYFLVSAILMAAFHVRSEAFVTFSLIFCAIVLEALPFMLLGTMLGGFVEVFVSREQLLRVLPKEKQQAVVVSAFLGILFPVCECAIVPVVRKFIQKGMPLGSAVAFLLAGPIVNPLVFSSTLVAYSFAWEVAFIRVFAGVWIAMIIGLIIDTFVSKEEALVPFFNAAAFGCGHAGCSHDHGSTATGSFVEKIRAALVHGAVDFYDIGRFLIIGAFVAAALQTLVPRQAIMSVAQGPVAAILVMMGLAVVLNLCSEADAFIAASFQPIGISFSAQMAFMVLGPMLDIKLVLMYLGVFTRKMILLLVFLVCVSVFLAMAVLELLQWV